MRSHFSTAVLLLLATASGTALADRDALWRITDTRCVPAAASSAEMPPPCARVERPGDRSHGWTLIKDRRGVLQYLLMPSVHIPGIESPELLNADTPNFFAEAWRSRDLLDRLRGQPLPRDTVSLTLNPAKRRSQDHFHIHISCVRPELRARLAAAEAELPTSWAPLPGGWMNHRWFVRRVDAETLDGINPVAEVAAHVDGAAADMGSVGISIVGMSFQGGRPGFVLMATRFDPSDRSSGAAEHDVQDHDCSVLEGGASSASAAAAALP